MDPISVDMFVWVVGGLAIFFCGVLWALVKALLALRADFSAYQITAKDKFASVGYLKDVEKRLSDAVEHLGKDISRFDITIQNLNTTLSRLEGRLGFGPSVPVGFGSSVSGGHGGSNGQGGAGE